MMFPLIKEGCYVGGYRSYCVSCNIDMSIEDKREVLALSS